MRWVGPCEPLTEEQKRLLTTNAYRNLVVVPFEPERKPWLSHQAISFIKSAVRLAGYVLLPVNLLAAAVVLFVSEVIGVVEEIGH
jgi:hypothetical protein